jgi:hypothetical protein
MEHLDFIAWMVLYPISLSILEYLREKRKLLTGEKEASEGAKGFAAIIQLSVYVFIAIKLF